MFSFKSLMLITIYTVYVVYVVYAAYTLVHIPLMAEIRIDGNSKTYIHNNKTDFEILIDKGWY